MGPDLPDPAARLMPLALDAAISKDAAPLLASLGSTMQALVRRHRRFGALAHGSLAVSKPCGLYALGVNADCSRADMIHVGGHALILSDQVPVGFAEYTSSTTGTEGAAPTTLSIARIGLGREAADIWRTIEAALEMEAVQRGDFEVRLLYVNELHLVFVWLFGDASLFLPIADGHGFKAGTPYAGEVMIEAVLRRIDTQIAAEDLLRHIDEKKASRFPPGGRGESGGRDDE